MVKGKYWVCFITFFTLSFSYLQAIPPKNEKFFIATMQKGGTFLMHKLFYILTRELRIKQAKNYAIIHLNTIQEPDKIDKRIKPYLLSKSTKIVIIIRDLRDVAVSYFFFKHRSPHTRRFQNNVKYRDNFLLDLILCKKKKNSNHQFDLLVENVRMLDFFLQFNPCIVKFENIVGEKGGGSVEAQVEEIQKMCDFLHIPITNYQMEYVVQNLFGLRPSDKKNSLLSKTFRSGQIGEYKLYFNSNHSRLFQEIYGNYLHKYGYE